MPAKQENDMTKARKIASYCLFPLTMWYGIGVMLRNMMFALDIKRETAPHVTTIGVGNLATGGTGKTPLTEYLLRLLADDYDVAFLSRGYKRKTKGFVVADGAPDARQLGDEAIERALARHGGKVGPAAKELGISERTIYRKLAAKKNK